MYIQKIKERKLVPSVIREIAILQKISKIPGCIKALDIFHDSQTINIVTNFYPRGDLYRFCRKNLQSLHYRFPEVMAHSYFKQMIIAIEKVHKMGIVHRDLKPENILLSNDLKTIYISDFGFALEKTDPLFKRYNRVGTPEFYPYEMLVSKPNGYIEYDEKIDIWCMGVILFEMLYGVTPFYSKCDDKDQQEQDTK